MSDYNERSPEIFLSYAREDMARVGIIVEALQNMQWSVFWDREIPPGMTWREAIGNALDQARVVIVAWSRHSIKSRWVAEEAEQALERGILVPVLLDDVELPLGFRGVQTARLTEWKGSSKDPNFNVLVERIAHLIGKEPTQRLMVPRKKKFNRGILTSILAGITVGVLAWSVWMWRTGPGTEYRRVFYESFDEPFDQSSGIWLLGKRDGTAWEGSVRDGVYNLCNVEQDPAASFTNRLAYDIDGKAIDQSDARISARIAIKPPFTQWSAAGLLFRASVSRPDYYALVVTPGGTVSLYRRTPETLKVSWSAELPGVEDSKIVELAMVGAGAAISVYVGGELIHEFEDQDLLTGDPGIFAYSRGCFDFDEVAVFHPVTGQ